MPELTDQEIQQLRRVLAAFRANLPPHELGYWRITKQSVATVVESESPPGTSYMEETLPDRIQVRGHGQCRRCRKQFKIPSIGNFTTWEKHLAETVERAKEWVRRDAERDGPCWGDVPTGERVEGAAILDAR